MIAKLHRFYGPAPHPTGNWLDVPEWLFAVYDRAQPRLEAEEVQMTLKTLIAGTGHMKDEEFRTYQRQLERQASGGEDTRSAFRPHSEAEMRQMIKALGFPSSFKVEVKH